MTIDIAIILTPFIMAALIPIFYRRLRKNVIGWVVLIIPVSLFLLLTTYIPRVAKGEVFHIHMSGSPRFI